MKSPYQILKALLLFTVYCFGIYTTINILPDYSKQIVSHKNGQKEYLTTFKVLTPHTEQSEVLFSGLTEYPSPDYNLSYKGFWIISTYGEVLFSALFKQYKSHFKTLLIRHRKSDLIFPFHNFW